MTTEWYYSQQGQQQGPVSEEELRRLAAAGEIGRDDLVWHQGLGDWKPAGEVPGVLPEAPAPPPPPGPPPAPATPPPPGTGPGGMTAAPITSVTIPILISGISNIVWALSWLVVTFCFGVVFTVALAILCIFELQLYSQAERLPRQELAAKARTLGILEVVAGVFTLNPFALVCGILVLVNQDKLVAPRV